MEIFNLDVSTEDLVLNTYVKTFYNKICCIYLIICFYNIEESDILNFFKHRLEAY